MVQTVNHASIAVRGQFRNHINFTAIYRKQRTHKRHNDFLSLDFAAASTADFCATDPRRGLAVAVVRTFLGMRESPTTCWAQHSVIGANEWHCSTPLPRPLGV